MSRHCWTEPAPYANGHSPERMFIDSAADAGIPSPSTGGVVPAGWVRQVQADDGSLDATFQQTMPVASGGWPAYASPPLGQGGNYPLPPNPALGAGL